MRSRLLSWLTALPLVVASLLAASFTVLLIVLLAASSRAGFAWTVADTPVVLAATLFLLAGIAVVTAVAALFGLTGRGGRASWIVLGIAGAVLAVFCLVWFAGPGRALVLAVPCAYLAAYAGVRSLLSGRVPAGRREDVR